MVDNENVEWRQISEFPHYAVSSDGRVKRVKAGMQAWAKPGKILTPDLTKDGHHRVTLFNEGRRTRVFVHRLVCEAWHGPAPSDKPLSLHKDDNKDNNSPGNLYWGDRKDNGADSHRNGRSIRGEQVITAKLTEAEVVEIRKRAYVGETNVSLAREFGIPDSAISSIVRGRNWKHVGGPIVTFSRRGRRQIPANDNATTDATNVA